MTPKQEKYLTEKYIRPMVKKILMESQPSLKIVLQRYFDRYGIRDRDQLIDELVNFIETYKNAK